MPTLKKRGSLLPNAFSNVGELVLLLLREQTGFVRSGATANSEVASSSTTYLVSTKHHSMEVGK